MNLGRYSLTELTQTFSAEGRGLKIAVKDCLDVLGFPTTSACKALADVPVAADHAKVVQLLIDAGCVLVGKTNMHELAFGMTGVNDWTGTPVNPTYPDLITGGSSSGSAALAAQDNIDFTLGTDTGGSIRLPAACCGVFGLKPTYGRVSRKGAYPLQSSLDCVGPLSSSIDKIIAAMKIIDPSFRSISPIADVSVGLVSTDSFSVCAPEIQGAVEKAVQRMTQDVHLVELPTMKSAYEAGMDVIGAETYIAFGHLLETGKVGSDVAARLNKASAINATALKAAETVRTRFTSEVDGAFDGVVVLALPTLPSFPMSRKDALAGKTDLMISAFVRPFNLSGHPAISIPLPPIEGRPVALQLVGKKGQDEFLCEVARAAVRQVN